MIVLIVVANGESVGFCSVVAAGPHQLADLIDRSVIVVVVVVIVVCIGMSVYRRDLMADCVWFVVGWLVT